MKSPGCSVYLCSRVLLGVLDIVSDLVIATHLILEQQVVWGCLVAGWVLLGFLGSLLHVVIRRCRSNIPLTSLKYFLLTLISMVLLSFISYYHQVRSAKTAAKTWSTINTSPASNVRSPLKPQRLETGLPCLTDDPPSGVTTPVTSRPCSPTPSSLSHTRPVSMMYPYSPTAPAHVSADVSRDSFPGGRRCEDDDCTTCVWLREGPNFQSTATRKKYKFMTPATCTDTCLVYLVTCTKCRKQYVGSCVADLRHKNSEHRQDIDLQRNLLGRHFASVCGYDFWSITIIDNCPRSELSRRQRFWIQELVTRFPVGLNESQDLM